MATKYLINTVREGTFVRYAGSSYDTTTQAAEIASVEAAGGALLDSTAPLAAASLIATQARLSGNAEAAASIMQAAAIDDGTSLAAAAVPADRQVLAGAGLTGGGALTSDRTFDVAAADASIVVTANDVKVGVVSDTQHGTRGGGNLHAIATAGAHGFMDSADKTKLDAIQTFEGALVGGELVSSTVAGLAITASSRVVGVVAIARAGVFPAGGFEALAADNVIGGIGVGSVKITARKADGTLENACLDTVAALIAG